MIEGACVLDIVEKPFGEVAFDLMIEIIPHTKYYIETLPPDQRIEYILDIYRKCRECIYETD